MTGPPSSFQILESDAGDAVRLSPAGDLDMQSAPLLDQRLTALRASKRPVLLDLSRVKFIDSTGLHLLIRTVGDARIKHWRLEIDPEVSPEVMRLLKLVKVDRFIIGNETSTDAPT
jgi:anti-anti-sigma factor